MPRTSPFDGFLERQGCVVLDGGLATALEARGHRLDTRLWSARLLIDAPEAIRAVHADYLAAGADCITTASYQASLPGLREAGLDEREAEAVLLRSVTLAVEARDAVTERPRPLVAASVGPYGAYLADGSEYDGRYGVDAAHLREFHARRFELLEASDADLLACETIPSAVEADVLLELLDRMPERWAWLSFTCQDGQRISDGTPFENVVRACASHDRVAAVGVNCTAPHHVSSLLAIAAAVTDLPLVAYPNSGERYEAATGSWIAPSEWTPDEWRGDLADWVRNGARVIGGCCRIGPDAIREMRKALIGG